MAERRMFSKSIINSGRFLRMPPTSRLLYYDLGMMADDDGIVEAYSVMAQTKATEDDLRVLVAKGFIRILNEDLVSYICDWNTNNTIRGDRYHPSIYAELIAEDTTGNGLTTNGIPTDNQLTTNGIPSGNQMETEVSIGKVNIGKNNNMSEFHDEFEDIWKIYPRKIGKPNAEKSYIKARKEGTTKEEVLEGLNRYNKYIRANKTEAKYIKHGSTWFNQHGWTDDYNINDTSSTGPALTLNEDGDWVDSSGSIYI
jgi:hypothetical protein